MIKLFSAVVLLFNLSAAQAADYRVSPIYIEVTQGAKKGTSFDISVVASDAGEVIITPYKAGQGIDGKLNFYEMADETKEHVRFELKEKGYKFLRAGEHRFKGEIKFLATQPETSAYALMVEEVKPKAKEWVGVHVRYAVVFKLTSSVKRIIENIEILPAEVSQVKEGIQVKVPVINKSLVDLDLTTAVKFRDASNQFVEEVVLNSQSSLQKKTESSIIFPNAKIELVGLMKNIKTPGTYKDQVVIKLKSGRSFTKSGEITIDPSWIKKESTKIEDPELSPSPLEVSLDDIKKGKSQKVVFKNKNGQALELEFSNAQLSGFDIKMMPSKVSIPPQKERTVMVKLVSANKDAANPTLSAEAVQVMVGQYTVSKAKDHTPLQMKIKINDSSKKKE